MGWLDNNSDGVAVTGCLILALLLFAAATYWLVIPAVKAIIWWLS